MPRGDGSGPPTGAAGRAGRNAGNRAGAGPSGDCVCPKCGKKLTHQQGVPCNSMTCPACGSAMVRG